MQTSRVDHTAIKPNISESVCCGICGRHICFIALEGFLYLEILCPHCSLISSVACVRQMPIGHEFKEQQMALKPKSMLIRDFADVRDIDLE